MYGLLFAAAAGLLVPVVMLIGSAVKKELRPFVLGLLAFTISQLLIRLPLLGYLDTHSTGFAMMGVLHPVFYAVFLGATAALAEELARYAAMRWLMRKRSWQSGFFFGAGHGGIEAVILLGIPAAGLLLTGGGIGSGGLYAVGGAERLFAMLLHIGLSILVLRSVTTGKRRYLFAALGIHAAVDTLAGLLPRMLGGAQGIVVTELTVALAALALFGWCLVQKRKDGWT